jgi:hypothetical protein
MRMWIVHLATPNVPGEFEVLVTADTEHGALAKALSRYTNCYVVFTQETTEWTNSTK